MGLFNRKKKEEARKEQELAEIKEGLHWFADYLSKSATFHFEKTKDYITRNKLQPYDNMQEKDDYVLYMVNRPAMCIWTDNVVARVDCSPCAEQIDTDDIEAVSAALFDHASGIFQVMLANLDKVFNGIENIEYDWSSCFAPLATKVLEPVASTLAEDYYGMQHYRLVITKDNNAVCNSTDKRPYVKVRLHDTDEVVHCLYKSIVEPTTEDIYNFVWVVDGPTAKLGQIEVLKYLNADELDELSDELGLGYKFKRAYWYGDPMIEPDTRFEGLQLLLKEQQAKRNAGAADTDKE